MTDRDEFEKWCIANKGFTGRHPKKGVIFSEHYWKLWQASRSALMADMRIAMEALNTCEANQGFMNDQMTFNYDKVMQVRKQLQQKYGE